MRKTIVFMAFMLALAGCRSDEAATGAENAEVKPAETAEAKPAEAKEVKPAEAKDAKPAEAKDAKPAEAKDAKPAEAKPAEAKKGDGKEGEAQPQPIVTAPRDFRDIKAETTYMKTIEADKEYDIGVKGLSAKVELKAGKTMRFQLTDLLESGKWVVRANNDQVVGVGLGLFKASLEKGVRSVTAVDLKAVKPGKSVLEMNYINDAQLIKRVFRCYITVK